MNFKANKFRVGAIATLASLGMTFTNVSTYAGGFSRFCTGLLTATSVLTGVGCAASGVCDLSKSENEENAGAAAELKVNGILKLFSGVVASLVAGVVGHQANETNKLAEKHEQELADMKKMVLAQSAPVIVVPNQMQVPNQPQRVQNPYNYGPQNMQPRY